MDDLTAADAPENEGKPPSELSDEAIYATLRSWYRLDDDHGTAWRTQAKADFDFVTPDGQWSPEEKAQLEATARVPVTFNRTLAMVKAIAGTEINGRHDTVYLPRGTEPGVVKANEKLSAASQWMNDGCDAEDEQSAAFTDMLTCGMGWVETRIDYTEDPDGKYIEAKVDPLEMRWDRAARSKNLVDGRRLFRARKYTLDEARDFAESIGADVDDEELDATWAVGADTDPGKPVEERRLRSENSTAHDDKKEVHIVHAQWIERQIVHRIALIDPETNQQIEKTIPDAKLAAFNRLAKEHGIKHNKVRQVRKVRKQAFLGKCVLGKVTDCPTGNEVFSFQAITGERDRNKGTWFGIVGIARDPQKMSNKFLSQTMRIIDTTAKGGIIAETDAFENIRDAQNTYAQPDAITFVKPGAVSKNKLMAKPGSGLATAYVQLLEYANKSIPDVIGVNMELLGMRGINQPGVLEAQRKQSAMTILATLFDSMRNFRKNIGRVRLHYIQNYLADGRLILITGEDGKEAIPLLRSQVLGEYQVIIEDAPTSPNQKQEIWAVLQQVMGMFKDIMSVEAVLLCLEYSPLPSKVVEAFKAMAAKAGEKTPEQIAHEKIAMDGAKAKVAKDEAGAEQARSSAFASGAKGLIDLATAVGMGVPTSIPEVQAIGEPTSQTIEGDIVGPESQPQQTMPQLPQMPGGPPPQPEMPGGMMP